MTDPNDSSSGTRWGGAVSHDELVQMVIDLTGCVTDLNSAIMHSMSGNRSQAADECEQSGKRVDRILTILASKLPEASDGRQ